MSSHPIDLGSIRAAGLSEAGVKILDIFDDVLHASISETGSGAGVERELDALRFKSAAKELDGLVPPIRPDEQNQPDVEAFLWELWNLLVQIAQLVPFDYDSGHGVLAGIVNDLRPIDRGTVTIWSVSLLPVARVFPWTVNSSINRRILSVDFSVPGRAAFVGRSSPARGMLARSMDRYGPPNTNLTSHTHPTLVLSGMTITNSPPRPDHGCR